MTQKTEVFVGKRIKELRTLQKLSLRTLSKKCGLSANTISLIERGENSATVSSLEKIANALNVSIDELFHKNPRKSIFHLKNQQGLKKTDINFEILSLGFGLDKRQIDPYFVTIFPDQDLPPKVISHPGQEFVYCISGELDYLIADQRFHLKEGDSVLFDAMHPHGWHNPNEDNAELILVIQSITDSNIARQNHITINSDLN